MHFYHSQKQPIIQKNYGRTLQRLIAVVAQQPDKHKRTQQAKALIRVMRTLNPTKPYGALQEQEACMALYHMTNNTLDVDLVGASPKPLPTTPFTTVPLAYPHRNLRTKKIGRLVPLFLTKSKSLTLLAKHQLIVSLLQLMQQSHTSNHHGAESFLQIMARFLPKDVTLDKAALLKKLTLVAKPPYRKKWKKKPFNKRSF